MMVLKEFLENVTNKPDQIDFNDTISVIEEYYHYTPCSFSNGHVKNEAGQNEGSCKIFAFAKLHDLDQQQTLHCFGKFYRDDVLNDPDGESHQNIRQFIQHGWDAIHFDDTPLVSKD